MNRTSHPLKTILRFFAIGRTLARHDALWIFDGLPKLRWPIRFLKLFFGRKRQGRKGQNLAQALAELGPAFIKLGQALSVRSDMVGEDVAMDLTFLQDKLPAFPAKKARQIIEEELGKSIEDAFTSFENEPVAAASIAQVHFATTTDGHDVAVKVLRPNIEALFSRDIELFYALANFAEQTQRKARRLRLVEVVHQFEMWVAIEMDLRLEAAAASELKENLKDEKDYYVPKVDWQRIGKRVLTTERIIGIRINDVKALKKAGHDPDKVLEIAARIFFLQVFRDGFFHADMHPGNAFVDSKGRIVPVDFGIMGRLNQETRYFLADLLLAFLNRDYRKVAEVHFDFGIVPSDKSKELFTQALRSIGEPLMNLPLHNVSIGKLLAHLFETTEQFDMPTQPDLLLLQKTMLMAEGLGRSLNPTVNMWVVSRHLIEDWMIANRGIEARIRQTAKQTWQTFETLPNQLNKIEAILDHLSQTHPLEKSNKSKWQKQRATPARQGISFIESLTFIIALLALILSLIGH